MQCAICDKIFEGEGDLCETCVDTLTEEFVEITLEMINMEVEK